MEIRIVFHDRVIDRVVTGLGQTAQGRMLLKEALNAGGDKTRTVIRKTLRQQMNTRTQGVVNKAVPSKRSGADLIYVIKGTGKGLPIKEFPTRFSRSSKIRNRWSRRDHWKVQPRMRGGRFGAIPATLDEKSEVSSTVWNAQHVFKRSFMGDDGIGRARLRPQLWKDTAKKGQIRRLYGASPAKEIIKDQSLESFNDAIDGIIRPAIEAKLIRLLRFA